VDGDQRCGDTECVLHTADECLRGDHREQYRETAHDGAGRRDRAQREHQCHQQ